MPQLEFSFYLSQMFWFLVTFGAFFGVVAKFVYPKIDAIISYRKEVIKRNLDDAKKMLQEVEDIVKLKDENRAATSSALFTIQSQTRDSIAKIKKDSDEFSQKQVALMMIEERRKIDIAISDSAAKIRSSTILLADKVHCALLGTDSFKPSSIKNIEDFLDLV